MTNSLKLIENFYRDKRAERTKIPLINHIYEGLEIMNSLEASDLKLSSKNLQNVPVTSKFQVKIESLIPNSTPKKSRYWYTPDQFSMTEAEHDRLFPYDIYKETPL